MILYNKNGEKQIETSNDNDIVYSPNFKPKEIDTALIKIP